MPLLRQQSATLPHWLTKVPQQQHGKGLVNPESILPLPPQPLPLPLTILAPPPHHPSPSPSPPSPSPSPPKPFPLAFTTLAPPPHPPHHPVYNVCKLFPPFPNPLHILSPHTHIIANYFSIHFMPHIHHAVQHHSSSVYFLQSEPNLSEHSAPQPSFPPSLQCL